MRRFRVLLLSCLPLMGEDIGTLEVEGFGTAQTAPFASVFEESEYLQTPSYLEKAPAQKRLTTDEAMFIPGVQGDPIKALKSLGGVTSLSDASGQLYIYGSKPEESRTSINHLPIGYLFHLFGIHSVIAPDAIDQIDAYLGGFDVTYGNAMGGVIDVTPKYPGGNDGGMVHIGIYDASVGAEYDIGDKWALYIGARRSYFDLFLDAVGETTGSLSDEDRLSYTQFPNYYDITAYLTYRLDGSNLFSIESISADDRLIVETQANEVKDPLATGEIDSIQGFNSIGLRHQYEGKSYRTNTLAYYMNSRTNSRFYEDYYVKIESDLAGLYHQGTYERGDHRLVFGGEFQHSVVPLDLNVSEIAGPEQVDFDFTTAQKYHIDERITTSYGVFFAEDIFTLSDALKLRYGLRYGYSDYQNLGHQIDPRASIIYAVTPRDTLSFSTGRYSQYPPGYKTLSPMGNPDLATEHAWHYLAHYDRDFGGGSTVSVEPYYKVFERLAIDDNLSRYTNDGEGYAYGVDVSAKLRSGDWYGFIAYTYLRSEREINTEDANLYRFYGEVPHTLQAMGSVRVGESWALSMLMKYRSGKPYTEVTGTYIDGSGRVRPTYGVPFAARLPDYFSLNLKIAQEMKLDSGELEWSFELMNATDHRNVTGIRYDDNYNAIGYYEELPLLPWIDITYRF